MRVLIVKTSSLGDLIHTLPALTDAAGAVDGVRFDWVAEQAFVDVPGWHPAVDRVIPIGLRRWRKGWRQAWRRGMMQDFWRRLREREYDLVIDAQGLLPKSAWVARAARGPAVGFDARSARDRWASLLYQQRVTVSRDLHAIARNRALFAAALGYAVPASGPDYGIATRPGSLRQQELLLLHGTTWPSKHYPEVYWAELIDLAAHAGWTASLPWASPDDRLRAERIIAMAGAGELLPRLSLTELRDRLSGAGGVIGLDSGLAHLAAAVGVPAVTLYGPTRSELTGAIGTAQQNLSVEFDCAPCMQRDCSFAGASVVRPACWASLPPSQVWQRLQRQVREAA